MKKYFATALVAVLGLALSAASAEAGFVLKLTQIAGPNAGATVTVTDGLVGVNPDGTLDGAVAYNSALGDFNINSTFGTSFPAVGDSQTARLNLISTNISSVGPSTLEILITNTDFNLTNPGPFLSTLTSPGGTTSGQVTFEYFVDTSNAEFGLATPIAGPAPGATGDLALGTFVSQIPDIPGPFSMTQRITIVHGAGSQQFTNLQSDMTVTAVPEPTSIAILALGGVMGGLGLRRRKRAERA